MGEQRERDVNKMVRVRRGRGEGEGKLGGRDKVREREKRGRGRVEGRGGGRGPCRTAQAGGQHLCRADNAPGGLDVPTHAVRPERGPCGSDHTPRPAAQDGRRRVDASRPVGDESVHRVAEGGGGEHEDRGALGGEAVLVRVARDGGNPGHAEVTLARQLEPGLQQVEGW